MKKIKNIFTLSAGILLVLSLLFSSCVKKEYDQPETANVDPNLTVNKSIAQINAMAAGTIPVIITSDVIIAGVVVADDASGNFYKEMIIQDNTGGISVQLDESNFNTSYPIGRRIFIKCKGLCIASDGNGNYQLGILSSNAVGRIPQTLIPQYLVPGQWGITVNPKTIHIGVGSPWTNTLVRLDSVEFQAVDTLQPYANAATLGSGNLNIEDCSSRTITLYSSGYADFANKVSPCGKGSIVAIYKIYRSAGELVIRSANEVNMNLPRCGH